MSGRVLAADAALPTKAPPIKRWEHRYLGEERFPETLSTIEIEHFFTLDEVMRRLAPIGHKHINMRGILSFDLRGHRSSLLCQTPAAPVQRVPR